MIEGINQTANHNFRGVIKTHISQWNKLDPVRYKEGFQTKQFGILTKLFEFNAVKFDNKYYDLFKLWWNF
jgi:hypothetical protein